MDSHFRPNFVFRCKKNFSAVRLQARRDGLEAWQNFHRWKHIVLSLAMPKLRPCSKHTWAQLLLSGSGQAELSPSFCFSQYSKLLESQSQSPHKIVSCLCFFLPAMEIQLCRRNRGQQKGILSYILSATPRQSSCIHHTQ